MFLPYKIDYVPSALYYVTMYSRPYTLSPSIYVYTHIPLLDRCVYVLFVGL